jgi:ABC-type Fe3+ transport system permease subunit
LAVGDLSASILVLPAGIDTISRRLFGLLHSGADDQVAGLALVTMFFFVLLTILVSLLLARMGAGKRTAASNAGSGS